MDEDTLVRRCSRALLLVSAVTALAFILWGLLLWLNWSPLRSLDSYPPGLREQVRPIVERGIEQERNATLWRSVGLVLNGVVFGAFGFVMSKRLGRHRSEPTR